jgi:imidazolonepropionase-like amidohydrolase
MLPSLGPASKELVDGGALLFAKRLQLVKELHTSGVPILVGTDAPLRPSPPGFGLHDELSLLVRAGLTPLEALRGATFEPARYLAATDSLGSIEPGKVADLVLLDGDPLADISNTRRISAVVANGRLFTYRERVQALVAAQNAAHPAPAH